MRAVIADTMVVALLLSGCATQKKMVRKERPIEVSVRQEPTALPTPIADAPPSPLGGAPDRSEEPARPSRRYTLLLTAADARELFLSLAKDSDLNVVLSPEVKGAVTLDLKEATAREVIEEACVLVRCSVEYAGRTIRISPLRRETRSFDIDYLLTTRAGQGTLTASTSTGGGGPSGSGSSSGAGGESKSVNSIVTDEKADFFLTLPDEVTTLLSGEGSKVALNRIAGTITVTDYPRNLEAVAAYLRRLAERSRTGVLIEAQILEVTLDDATQYGIDWSAMPGLSFLGLSGTLAGGAVISQSLQSGVATGAKIGVKGGRMSAFLDTLATLGQIHVLSSPKVATLNNQRAIIRIGRQDVFFQAIVTPATLTSAAIVTYSPVTITEGIVLVVTPQVARNGQVMMAIHPTITERVGTATAPDHNTAPIVDVRETNTVVTVADGQTVVIGGLMQERTQETVNEVPLLGSIPFLGALFRNTTQTKQKTELVILITPRVVPPTSLTDVGRRDIERVQLLLQGSE